MLVIAAACAPPASVAVEVRIVARAGDEERPFVFEPAALEVPVGARVAWVNDTDAYHTVTFSDSLEPKAPNGTFDEQLYARGERTERVLSRAGTYVFYCQPHAGFMFGTIAVR